MRKIGSDNYELSPHERQRPDGTIDPPIVRRARTQPQAYDFIVQAQAFRAMALEQDAAVDIQRCIRMAEIKQRAALISIEAASPQIQAEIDRFRNEAGEFYLSIPLPRPDVAS